MALDLFKILKGLTIGISVPFFVGVASAEAPASGSPADHLQLKLSLGGESYQTPFVRTLLFGPTLDLIYGHDFNPYLESRVDVAFEALTGSASGILPTDLLGQMGPRQIFRLREAVVDVHTAGRGQSFSVGAINQRGWSNPLLGGDLVFLGALSESKVDTAIGHVGVRIEGAVPPTSFSLLETAAQGQTPTFAAAQVADLIGQKDHDFTEVHLGYFQFNNLTTAQAKQSLFWGNTVTGNTRSASFYLPYRGVEAGLKGGVDVGTRWQLVAASNFVLNTAAPAGAGQGYLASLGTNYRLNEAKLALNVGYFNDQSDSSPAGFSDAFLNSKNHRGVFLEVRYDAPTYSVFARGLRAEALVPQAYAGQNTGVLIGIEVRHDLLK